MAESRTCPGWGHPCGVEITEERIFGEVFLCERCCDQAWDDYIEACKRVGKTDRESGEGE